MSVHRTKRPFAGAASDPAQRQITSFFQKATPGAYSEQQQPAVALRPNLPADTESNLLTVGMRVRKSVPEGYKTGSSYSAFNLFKDTTAEEVQQQKRPQQQRLTSSQQQQRSAYTTAHRELLPFCAIHAVGGLAVQPPSPPFIRHDSLDDVPSLSSSQSSLASNTSTTTATMTEPLATSTIGSTPFASTRKRSYDAGDESDTPSVSDCLQVPNGEWMDGQVSPRSLVPVGWENTRVMAMPKRARQRSLKARAGGGGGGPAVIITGDEEKLWTGLGQENMRMMVDEDFPEADFLDYGALEGDAMEL